MKKRFKSGSKLEQLRVDRGLSQEQFAELAGVTRQTAYRWESGESLPSMKNISVICDVLEVSRQELFEACPEEIIEAAELDGEEECAAECEATAALTPVAEAAAEQQPRQPRDNVGMKEFMHMVYSDKRKIRMVWIIVFAALLAFSLFVTVCLNIITFPQVTNDPDTFETLLTYTVDRAWFGIMLAVSAVIAAIEALLVIEFLRFRKRMKAFFDAQLS